MRRDGTIADYFPGNTGVRQGSVLPPTIFNTCMDHVLERMSEKSGCRLTYGIAPITDLGFANDAVIFSATAVRSVTEMDWHPLPLELVQDNT